ncbi:MAG: hypothetical protein OEY29_12610 [Gammaproteobacteria bacterium]|nr:hypothetical protein [Gammaproteobacteria bacterium]
MTKYFQIIILTMAIFLLSCGGSGEGGGNNASTPTYSLIENGLHAKSDIATSPNRLYAIYSYVTTDDTYEYLWVKVYSLATGWASSELIAQESAGTFLTGHSVHKVGINNNGNAVIYPPKYDRTADGGALFFHYHIDAGISTSVNPNITWLQGLSIDSNNRIYIVHRGNDPLDVQNKTAIAVTPYDSSAGWGSTVYISDHLQSYYDRPEYAGLDVAISGNGHTYIAYVLRAESSTHGVCASSCPDFYYITVAHELMPYQGDDQVSFYTHDFQGYIVFHSPSPVLKTDSTGTVHMGRASSEFNDYNYANTIRVLSFDDSDVTTVLNNEFVLDVQNSYESSTLGALNGFDFSVNSGNEYSVIWVESFNNGGTVNYEYYGKVMSNGIWSGFDTLLYTDSSGSGLTRTWIDGNGNAVFRSYREMSYYYADTSSWDINIDSFDTSSYGVTLGIDIFFDSTNTSYAVWQAGGNLFNYQFEL